jgi:hypothetical protein
MRSLSVGRIPLAFPAIFALATLAASVYGISSLLPALSSAKAMERDGQKTVAEVTETFSEESRLHGLHMVYRVRYIFDSGGVRRKGSCALPQAEWEDARRSGRIQIIYRKSDPSVSIPATANPFDAVIGWCFWCTIAIVVCITCCWRLFRQMHT